MNDEQKGLSNLLNDLHAERMKFANRLSAHAGLEGSIAKDWSIFQSAFDNTLTKIYRSLIEKPSASNAKVDADKFIGELDWLTETTIKLEQDQHHLPYKTASGGHARHISRMKNLNSYATKLISLISQHLENGNLEGFDYLRVKYRLREFELFVIS
ncbi:hypothetical protein N9Y42_08440 [Mariniblastus sp.]|nr:hypothetical protein [Mariniblastus sp.]